MATLNERMLALMNMRAGGGASEFEYQRALGYMAQQDALGNPLDAAQALAWARAQQAQQPNVGTYSTPNGGVQAALQQAGIAPQATNQIWAPAQGRLPVATADPSTWTNWQNAPMSAEEQAYTQQRIAAGRAPQDAVNDTRAWASQNALTAATTPPTTAPTAPVTSSPASNLGAPSTGTSIGTTAVAGVPPVQPAYEVAKALEIAGVSAVGPGPVAAAPSAPTLEDYFAEAARQLGEVGLPGALTAEERAIFTRELSPGGGGWKAAGEQVWTARHQASVTAGPRTVMGAPTAATAVGPTGGTVTIGAGTPMEITQAGALYTQLLTKINSQLTNTGQSALSASEEATLWQGILNNRMGETVTQLSQARLAAGTAAGVDVNAAPAKLGVGTVVNAAGKVVTLIGETALKASAIPGLDSVLGPALVTYLVGKLLDMSVKDKSDPAVVERVMNAEADVYAREQGIDVGSNTWKFAKEGVLNLVASGEVAQEERTVTGESVGSQPGATSTVSSRVPGWARPSPLVDLTKTGTEGVTLPEGMEGGGLEAPEGAKAGGGGDGAPADAEQVGRDTQARIDAWAAAEAERQRAAAEAERQRAAAAGDGNGGGGDTTIQAAPGELPQQVLDVIMNRAAQTTDTRLAVPNMQSLGDAVAAAMARAGIGNAPQTAPTVDNTAVNAALSALLPQLQTNAGVAPVVTSKDTAGLQAMLAELQDQRNRISQPAAAGGISPSQQPYIDAQIAEVQRQIAAATATPAASTGTGTAVAPNALTDALTQFVQSQLTPQGAAPALTTLGALPTGPVAQSTPGVPSTLANLPAANIATSAQVPAETGNALLAARNTALASNVGLQTVLSQFRPNVTGQTIADPQLLAAINGLLNAPTTTLSAEAKQALTALRNQMMATTTATVQPVATNLRQQMLDLVSSQFGQRGSGLSGDLNRDGAVDTKDVIIAGQLPGTGITAAPAAPVTAMTAAPQVAAPTITAPTTPAAPTITPVGAVAAPTVTAPGATVAPTITPAGAATVTPSAIVGPVSVPQIGAPTAPGIPGFTPTGAAGVAPITPVGPVTAPTITGAPAVTAPTVTAQSGSTIQRLTSAIGKQLPVWMQEGVTQVERALGRPMSATEIDAVAGAEKAGSFTDAGHMLERLAAGSQTTPAATALSRAQGIIEQVAGAPSGTALAGFTPTAGTTAGLGEAAGIRAQQMATLGPQAQGQLAPGVSAALAQAGIISPEQEALQGQALAGTSDILRSLLLEAQGQPSESLLRSEQALMDQVRNEIARQGESLGSNLAGRGLVGSGTALGLAGEMRAGLLKDVIAQTQQGREGARQAAIQSVLGYTGQIGQQTLAEKTLSVSTAMQKAGLSQGAIDSALAQMTSLQGTASAEATARVQQELDRAVAAGQLSVAERTAAMSAATSLAGTLGAQGLTATGATQAAETAAADRALQAALASAGFQVQTGEAAAARAQEAALATAGYGVQTGEAAATRAQQAAMAEAAARTQAAEAAATRAQEAARTLAGYEYAGGQAQADREFQATLAQAGYQVSIEEAGAMRRQQVETANAAATNAAAEAAAARAQQATLAGAGYEFAGGEAAADRELQARLANQGVQVSTAEAGAARAQAAREAEAGYQFAGGQSEADRAVQIALANAGYQVSTGEAAAARAQQASGINAAAANAAAEAAAARAQEATLTGAGQAFTAAQTAQAQTLQQRQDAVNAVLAALGLEQQGALAAGAQAGTQATAGAQILAGARTAEADLAQKAQIANMSAQLQAMGLSADIANQTAQTLISGAGVASTAATAAGTLGLQGATAAAEEARLRAGQTEAARQFDVTAQMGAAESAATREAETQKFIAEQQRLTGATGLQAALEAAGLAQTGALTREQMAATAKTTATQQLMDGLTLSQQLQQGQISFDEAVTSGRLSDFLKTSESVARQVSQTETLDLQARNQALDYLRVVNETKDAAAALAQRNAEFRAQLTAAQAAMEEENDAQTTAAWLTFIATGGSALLDSLPDVLKAIRKEKE